MRLLTLPIIVFSLFMMYCDKGTEPEAPKCGPLSDPASELEILYPSGDDQFKAGETINIQWKVNSRKISKVNLSVSVDDGYTLNDILTTMLVPDNNEIECMNAYWEIGKLNDNSQIIDKDTTLLLIISDYDGDASETVVVKVKK